MVFGEWGLGLWHHKKTKEWWRTGHWRGGGANPEEEAGHSTGDASCLQRTSSGRGRDKKQGWENNNLDSFSFQEVVDRVLKSRVDSLELIAISLLRGITK